jgi:hypothetical protein
VSYVLQAFIADPDTLTRLAKDSPSSRPVQLAQGLALLPFTDPLREALMSSAPIVERYRYQPFSCLSWHGGLKAQGIAGPKGLAYVEAEFFGGVGDQNAILWRLDRVVEGPVTGPRVINRVLKLLGVQCQAERDEFDTLGLRRFRETAHWARPERTE